MIGLITSNMLYMGAAGYDGYFWKTKLTDFRLEGNQKIHTQT